MGVIYVIFGIVIGFSLYSLNKSQLQERQAFINEAEFKQLGIEIADASDYLTNQARQYVQFGDKQYLDNYWKEVNETKTRDKVVDRLKELNALPEELNYIEEAKKQSDALVKIEDEAMKAVVAGKLDQARKLMFGEDYNRSKEIIMKPIKDFQDQINARAQQERQDAEKVMNVYLYLSISLIVCMFGLIIFTFVLLFRKIKPLALVSDQLGILASNEGDLTVRLPVNSHDEIGMISDNFNKMIENFQRLVIEIKNNTTEITTSAEVLARESDVVTESTLEITKSIAGIASGNQIQQQSTSESARAMEEMAAGIQRIAESTSSVADSSVNTAEEAKEGNKLIQKALGQMKSINNIVNDSVEITNSLGLRSNEIGQIVALISQIADQTNLLALNAAIEAARAGEQGKGFAVVANEVRKLAEETAKATGNISELIKTIQSDSNAAVEYMGSIKDEVSVELDIIEQSGVAFEKILRATQIVATQVEEFSATSEEMSASTQEVTASVEEVARIAGESAGNTERVAQQSKTQQQVIENIRDSIQGQMDKIHKLQTLISKFKV